MIQILLISNHRGQRTVGNIRHVLTEKKGSSRILSPVSIFFKNEGEMARSDKRKLRGFITSKLALLRKHQLQISV